MRLYTPIVLLCLGLSLLPMLSKAQTAPDTFPQQLTLEQCVNFALQNRPAVQQANLDVEINERNIQVELADWYPQVSAVGTYNRNLKLQYTAFGDQIIQIGRKNTSNLIGQATQNLFSNDLMLASRTSRYVRLGAEQNVKNIKISTIVEVSKAFYDLLFTQEQLRTLDEAIIRLEKQQKDAYAQYQNGLVDITDYQRATINLNSTRSDRKRADEATRAKLSYLKQVMGYEPDRPLSVNVDRAQMEQGLLADTLQGVLYANRIEFQQLQTQKQLQKLNISYYRNGYLPEVTAAYNYNFTYLNDSFSNLYNNAFPSSTATLNVSIPIFQGRRRIHNLRREELEDKRLDLDIFNLKSTIHTEYNNALANYKSNLNEWNATKQNLALAQDVYRIIKLQYDEGIKAYLEVITAETDLRTTQLNYYNALYNVLASKLDLDRAQGNIIVNQ